MVALLHYRMNVLNEDGEMKRWKTDEDSTYLDPENIIILLYKRTDKLNLLVHVTLRKLWNTFKATLFSSTHTLLRTFLCRILFEFCTHFLHYVTWKGSTELWNYSSIPAELSFRSRSIIKLRQDLADAFSQRL